MDKTCATCRHWDKQPADPNNLGAPPLGLCREGPPQFVLVPTPQGLMGAWMQPQPAGTAKACSRHQERWE